MTIFMMSCAKTEVPEPIKFNTNHSFDTCKNQSVIIDKTDSLDCFKLKVVNLSNNYTSIVEVDSINYKSHEIGDNWCL